MRAEITVAAVIENLEKVSAFTDKALAEFNCPERTAMQVQLAVDELFTNIVSYAYPGGEGNVTVLARTRKEPSVLELIFSDEGIPFDPLSSFKAAENQGEDPDKIGGLGIYLVKKLTDEVRYEYRNGRNILLVRKNIG